MNKKLSALLNEYLTEKTKDDDRVIVLNTDVAKSVGIREFGKSCPGKFVQLGVSEQDMFLTAAGLASEGFIPIVTTFAKFGSLRVAEQISTFIAYPKQNVKILVSHAGISASSDGVTHQAIEDIGVISSIPNMTVIEAIDDYSTRELLDLAVDYEGPVYIRMNRESLPTLMSDYTLSIGKGILLREGLDIAIVACGSMVSRALEAAEKLNRAGINTSVAAIHTIKPIDEELIIKLAQKTGTIVTAEEHNVFGGLGAAVSKVVTENYPVPVIRVGIKDTFAQSGNYQQLINFYQLSSDSIVEAVHGAIKMKKMIKKGK